jgi:GTP-binding protein HflX
VVAAGASVVHRVIQERPAPNPALYFGRGKIEEVAAIAPDVGANLFVSDDPLSPIQERNLSQAVGMKVIDRTALILDIFALHARSREGKAQVELAQLNYLLPRLRGWGEAMSRLGGGIGTRGPGETKMEVDRQHIRRRIAKLRRDIKTLAKTRDLKRSRRQDSGIPQVAIAGYTNAGKSTLMKRLTGADVIVAEKLFATLDPTTRRIELPGKRRAVISDTVGFVGKLPHDLVEAFRSTLEEVVMADLIVHIADATSPALDEQVDAVRRVLGEIGAGQIPEVLALNKIDRVPGSLRARLAGRFPGSVAVSALTGEGADELREEISERIPRPPVEVTLLVPFGREDITARLYREAEVLSTEMDTDGTVVRARVGLRLLSAVRGFLLEQV